MQALDLERTLTELDHVRIKNLIRRDPRNRLPSALAQQIEETLDASAVVPAREVPPDVVTMYSQVLLADPAGGERTKLALCYPADAEPAAGFVSVLSPLGLSLLGLRVGDLARWSTPAGGERTAEVVAILFQPEASGDYSL
ncbi:MAG: Regulator of nucleoside diphosphate kinase [Burkholderiaceae bacterium]|nr:Regulator of nucleoside diphosphate kinase [Burkholderiaceae bacterium]